MMRCKGYGRKHLPGGTGQNHKNVCHRINNSVLRLVSYVATDYLSVKITSVYKENCEDKHEQKVGKNGNGSSCD
jgi:hypothetical protein